jgi:Zn/Cd-binding protein ZinT
MPRKFAMAILLCFLLVMPCIATETLLMNEIDPKIIRGIVSNKDVLREISILVQNDFKWVYEFVHASSIEGVFEIQLIFEKNKTEKRLVVYYEKGTVTFKGYVMGP